MATGTEIAVKLTRVVAKHYTYVDPRGRTWTVTGQNPRPNDGGWRWVARCDGRVRVPYEHYADRAGTLRDMSKQIARLLWNERRIETQEREAAERKATIRADFESRFAGSRIQLTGRIKDLTDRFEALQQQLEAVSAELSPLREMLRVIGEDHDG